MRQYQVFNGSMNLPGSNSQQATPQTNQNNTSRNHRKSAQESKKHISKLSKKQFAVRRSHVWAMRLKADHDDLSKQSQGEILYHKTVWQVSVFQKIGCPVLVGSLSSHPAIHVSALRWRHRRTFVKEELIKMGKRKEKSDASCTIHSTGPGPREGKPVSTYSD